MPTLQEIRARLDQLNNRNNASKGVWKPKDEHDVRLVPPPAGQDPFEERKFHHDVAEREVLCPSSFGDECQFCEIAEKLKSWRDEDGKDKPEVDRKNDFAIFRKIQAKPRFFARVVVRGEEDKGIVWWSMTEKVFKDLANICLDKDWNADRDDEGGYAILTSPTQGLDISVSFQKPGQKGNKTNLTLIVVAERKKFTKLLADKSAVTKLLETSPASIDDVFPRPDRAETSRAFQKWVNDKQAAAPAVEDKGPGAEGREYGSSASKPSANAERLTGTKTVDEMLDSLVQP